MWKNDTEEHEYNLLELAQVYGIKDISEEAFPLTYKYLDKGQRSDPSLLKAANNEDTPYTSKAFVEDGRTYNLIVYFDKVVIPEGLKKRMVEWYHTYLLHPGINCTEKINRQHFW